MPIHHRLARAFSDDDSLMGGSMRIFLWLVAVIVGLAGCAEDKPHDLVGTWASDEAGSKIRLIDGGDCMYFLTPSGGLPCEWEPTGDRKGTIIIRDDGVFVEGSLEIVSPTILFFRTPDGILNPFQKKD